MLGLLWRRGVQRCVGARKLTSFPMLGTDLRPLEGLGLDTEDFIKLYNRTEASRGEDPLAFLTDKKTMLKVKRNLDLLENLGMSVRERKVMVMGTDRVFESTPDVLEEYVDFYKRKLDFTDAEVARFFVSYPDILRQSLRNHVAERVAIYRVLGLKRKSVRRMIFLYPQLLTLKLDDYLIPAMRVVAKAHFSLKQGMSLLKYYPDLVGIPREELKIVFHVLKRGGLSANDIINMYRSIAKVRLHAPGRDGLERAEVLWTSFRKESGEKLGVIAMRDTMIWGARFQKEEIKEMMESRGKDWRPVWAFLETKRLEIQYQKEFGSDMHSSEQKFGIESGDSSDRSLHDAIDHVMSGVVHDGEKDGGKSDSDEESDGEADAGNQDFSEAFSMESIDEHQYLDEYDVKKRINMAFEENVADPR
ncbi:hypothetical protein BSKO_08903 [Bryopsis sp. KO-2023]|nr:hypothetical protein BSKO_08903 [Bryopsis sp. KO-2023]